MEMGGTFAIWHWLMVAIYVAAIVIPVRKILLRAGLNPWLSIIAIVPGINIIGLWMLASARWPSIDRPAI
jgi:hypothetical protein